MTTEEMKLECIKILAADHRDLTADQLVKEASVLMDFIQDRSKVEPVIQK